VARIGGDEFVLMQTNLHQIEDATKVAQKIINELSRPIVVDDIIAKIGASIGIAIYPEHGTSLEDLLKSADRSMYEVKRAGKNNFQVSSTAQS
jgi:diguanylate cyclase (GGDEF)-like protein